MAGLLAILLLVIPLWKICGRAGFHPALSLLVVIPFLGLIIVICVLAFADWPVSKRETSRGGE